LRLHELGDTGLLEDSVQSIKCGMHRVDLEMEMRGLH
jgi:hypothetical protein